jgi:hypothetical protein
MATVAGASGVSLDRVGALRGTLFGLSFLAGPAVAGWLLSVMPTVNVIWITAACNAVAALAIAVMPLPAQDPAPTGDASPFAGVTVIRRSAPLLALLVISLGSVVLVGPLLSIVLPAHFTLLGAPGLLGISLSAYAVGTIVGSAAYGWAFSGRRWAAWVLAHLLYVVSGILIATLTGFWLVAGGMAAAGIATGLLQPITMVVLTTQVPDELRGRVFGAYTGLTMVVSPVGLGLLAAVLAGADLMIGAWVLAAGWVLVAAYAILAPGLKSYIVGAPSGREDLPHADHQTAG